VASHRSLLSPSAKAAIARELGVADLVQEQGWGAVSSRECGSVVRVALQHAERLLAQRAQPAAPAGRWSR
jgi:small acid-soluble spore protein F (minor alpha/beta-type SASP)